MTTGNNSADGHSPSLPMWLLRKFAPMLIVAAGIGFAISVLGTNSPSLLRILGTIAGIGFGLCSLLYFYWAVEPGSGSGHRWTVCERIGVALSGLGALVIAVKLVAPDSFPGSSIAYFIGGALLAFAGRPFFDYLASRTRTSEQVGADQPTAAVDLKSE